MSVQAFTFYDKYRKYISGTVTNGSTGFKVHLCKSTSNAATHTLSTWGSVTNEVASGGNYKHSGMTMTKTWSFGSTTIKSRLNFTALSLSASGNITSIMFFVLVATTGASAKDGANKLVGKCSLSSGVFTVSSGNKLIINPSATGLFEMS